jgi:peptidoglycan/xylan/chitin deacetylase (PgdA/CDA1 family)
MIKRLPVLLYHAVAPRASQGLTIGVQQLEEQFKWLARKGYRSWHFSDLIEGQKPSGQKNVIITFDDGYVNQLEFAVPLLQKYGLCATFFVPLKYIGQKDEWNTNQLEIMNLEQLQSLDPKLVELGCHSFSHLNFRDVGLETVGSDIAKACLCINELGLRFSPVLAYPYGKFPRKQPEKKAFFELLQKEGFLYALRIGNRVNRYPFKSPYEIQRLDIKGEYSLSRFKRKLLFGKWP